MISAQSSMSSASSGVASGAALPFSLLVLALRGAKMSGYEDWFIYQMVDKVLGSFHDRVARGEQSPQKNCWRIRRESFVRRTDRLTLGGVMQALRFAAATLLLGLAACASTGQRI